MTKILLVEAPYYKEVSDCLYAGASGALEAAGVSYEKLTVPGALEIPAAIHWAAHAGRYDGFVALGCVIRGQTSHYDIVCNESARAIMTLTTQHNVPVGNGILTCENLDQALERADPARKNKGSDAALAALRLLEIKNMYK